MQTFSYDLEVDPVDLLRLLQDKPGVFLLESSMRQRERGRYSYLGFDPFLTVKGNDAASFARLEKTFQSFISGPVSPGTPFSGGLVGYLSYDFGLQFEKIQSRHRREGISEFLFGFYDCVIAIDHFQNKVIVSSNGYPEKVSLLRKKRASVRLKNIKKILADLPAQRHRQRTGRLCEVDFKSNFSKTDYCNAVKKALDYIKCGDIYQVNLAQEFFCQLKQRADSVELYNVLRRLSPSCFGGYMDLGPWQIVSSSPEMFLRLQNGKVETRPMKGTRPRGRTFKEDQRRVCELRHDGKEKAELLMVTDLERNDLGRVCDFGSVRVQEIREIEKYRTLYQATATVSGRLAHDRNGFDLIKACFPGGSITGCPKIRAMQIIDELEHSRRGIYTGALGYLGFNGNLALNVLIRTLLVEGKKVSFHVGSGIVADSNPRAEYAETLVKARALKESLRYAK